jgi:hypothetical protein
LLILTHNGGDQVFWLFLLLFRQDIMDAVAHSGKFEGRVFQSFTSKWLCCMLLCEIFCKVEFHNPAERRCGLLHPWI